MKKVVSAIILFLFTFTFVNAEECIFSENDFLTSQNTNETLTITGYSGCSKEIEIPTYINNIKVESIGENAFFDSELNSIKIMDNIDIFDSENTFNSNIILKGMYDSKLIEYAKKYNRNYIDIYKVTINNESFYNEGNSYTINIVEPTKEYYEFGGLIDSYGNVYKNKDTLTLIENTNLEYVWNNLNYTITFNLNGVNGIVNNINTQTNTDVLLPVNPYTKKNHKFVCWNTRSDGSGECFNANSTITNLTSIKDYNVTLYAIWGKKYTLSFDKNGGTMKSTTKTVYKGLKVGSMVYPSKKGYTFTGWYTSKNGGELIQDSTIYNYNKNIKLYAHYSIIKYDINYYLNNGTNNNANPSTYTIKNNVSLKNPSRKGYIFSGWYTSNKYKKKITKISKGSTGIKNLYAKWTPIKYNISYDANGGKGKTKQTSNVSYDKLVKLRKNGYTKKGYSFIGWSLNKNNTDSENLILNSAEVINLTHKNKKTVKLYANWNINTYTINYNLDGGINNEKNPSTYTVNSKFTFSDPTKEGYLFLGWYKDANYTNRLDGKINKGTTGNLNLFAKWVSYSSYEETGIEPMRYKMVDLAVSQIGNKNGKKYWTWWGSNYRRAWCAIFVSWLADQNGLLDNTIPKFIGVPTGYRWFKNHKQYKRRSKYTPKPGDVVFFDWNGNGSLDHVGIVEKVENGTVYTIEGNTTNQVARRKYPINSRYIHGYGVPNYSKEL